MSAINLSGNASGSGTFTIASPNSNTSYTLALPEEAGTITTSNSPYSTFRNRIINGDMRVAQRGTAAVTTTVSFPVDRFVVTNNSDASFSAQQDSSAPAGFVNSVKFTTTTADGTLTTTQNAQVTQQIEGTNVSDLGWGTANAKTVTLSFWVRSSLTGTFGGALRNSASDRSYPFTYSISSADTWEYKTVTVAGDTTGTWLTTTGIGITVIFGMGAGPDRSGTAGAWNSNNNVSATGAVSVIGTLNATWYITGVQLEVGSVATPFERRPYGQELSLCQRYFQFIGGTADASFAVGISTSATTSTLQMNFLNTMRASPTISTTGTFFITDNYSYNTDFTSISSSNLGVNSGRIAVNHTSGATTNRAAFMQSDNTTPSDNGINLSAEL